MKVFDARKLLADPEITGTLRMVRPLVLMMGRSWEHEAHGKTVEVLEADGSVFDEDWLSDSVEPLSWDEYEALLRAV